MTARDYPHLFSPFKLGHVTLRNRIVSTPLGAAFVANGRPTEEYLRYLVTKAKGGCGLIGCFGGASVHPTGRVGSWPEVHYWDDDVIPHLQRLSDAVHEHGAALVAQLGHRGHKGASTYTVGPLLAPSEMPGESHREVAHAMDPSEIAFLVDAFATAAARVHRGRFDGVDICAWGGHIAEQFLSPRSNRRNDAYGGPIANRARFLLELVAAVRAKTATDFVIGVRLSGDQLVDGGLELAEVKEVARLLEQQGETNYLTISGASAETTRVNAMMTPSLYYSPLTFRDYAKAVRQTIGIPVIYAGRVVTPAQAESLLVDDTADLVAMTRALISDPDLPEKARKGRIDDVRLCIGATEGCIGRNRQGLPIRCVQNPVIGHETELPPMTEASKRKHVLVAGGGPGGLEAARVLALRGHRVTLCEVGNQLGGQLNIVARAPGREAWLDAATWLIHQIGKLSVDVRSNTRVDADFISRLRPDCVIVATGAKPRRLSPAAGGAIPVFDAVDVISGAQVPGQRVLVVDNEGYMHASGAAEVLALAGKSVRVISPTWSIGEDLDIGLRADIHARLLEKSVALTPQHRLLGIESGGAVIENVFSRRREIVPADAVVIAIGQIADDDLLNVARSLAAETHAIGDCVAPRRLHDALLDANLVARRL
ncbi:MAG TPA: FAD-dependent oxidoreductase [Stellaceae bacterium]|nr:FAD-dependent oxidoreductase [Stellaceae bacterium]